MKSTLLDPNNHVPEVSPDDGWGDTQGVSPEPTSGANPVLPPRRIATPHNAAPAAATDQVGLRINPNLARGETPDTPQRLEVQELKSGVVRLGSTSQKIPRQITFRERPPPESHEAQSLEVVHQWGVSRRRPVRWIIAAGVGVLAIIILVMMLLPAINAPNAARQGPVEQPIVETKIEGLEEMNLLFSKQAAAMRIFSTYVSASQVDEIIPLLREGEASREALPNHWRPQENLTSWEPAADSAWDVLDVAGRPCGLLRGTLPDQSGFSAYFILDGNRLLLDWKATSGFGTATFGQLEKGLGDSSEIRGEISSADYHNKLFPEREYQSYRLLSPDQQIAIWCYARRDEDPDQIISPLLHENYIGSEFYQSRKITLRLIRGPSGAQPNQWLIEKVLHLEWVTP